MCIRDRERRAKLKPTEKLFAQQSRDAQSRRLLAGQLIAKSTVGDAAKAWKEYGKYTGLSEEAFYKQYGRSKLYKDEPTPEMKQAKIKGDFVKSLTKKKNFLQESDVDSNEAAQIFEGYQSLNNKLINLAGIMGGKSTACSAHTKTVLVECAYFKPEAIIGKSVKYDIKSEASHKFERGVDQDSQDKVLRRFIQVVIEHANIMEMSIVSYNYK